MKTNQTPPPPRARGATLREIVVEVTNMIPERGHFVLPRIMLAPSPRLSSPRLPHHVFVSTRRAHPSPAGERTTLPGLPPPASAAPPLLGSLSRWRAASPPRLLCQRPPPPQVPYPAGERATPLGSSASCAQPPMGFLSDGELVTPPELLRQLRATLTRVPLHFLIEFPLLL
jgi:hypothetical protein